MERMGGKTFKIENSSWKKLEIEMRETTPVPSVTGLRTQDTEERGKKIAKEKHLRQKTAIITAVGHIAWLTTIVIRLTIDQMPFTCHSAAIAKAASL